MSGPPISQIEYWKIGDSGTTPVKADEGGEGATFLSYHVFLALSFFGGYLGLDHLYLRSPLTALAKAVVNILAFGVWWLYDLTQALFNADVVRVFGLGVPGLGPQGIAAGVLGKDIPDKKHWRFFVYALALYFGGVFGLDSFLLGDSFYGFVRLILAISVIFLPIAFVWWLYKMYRFLIKTKEVLNDNHEFFGAVYQAYSKESRGSYPFLSVLLSPMAWVRSFVENVFGPIVKPIASSIDGVVALGSKTLDTGGKIIDGVKTVAEGVKSAIDVATQSVGVVPGAALYASVSPEAVAQAKADALSHRQSPRVEPSAPSQEPSVPPQNAVEAVEAVEAVDAPTEPVAAVKAPQNIVPSNQNIQPGQPNNVEPGAELMKGGALLLAMNLNPTHYLLLGTIVFIAVAGFALTYYRAQQDDTPNDAPPEPGVLRESDTKRRGT